MSLTALFPDNCTVLTYLYLYYIYIFGCTNFDFAILLYLHFLVSYSQLEMSYPLSLLSCATIILNPFFFTYSSLSLALPFLLYTPQLHTIYDYPITNKLNRNILNLKLSLKFLSLIFHIWLSV